MGLGLGVIAAIPTTIGTGQAVSAQKRQDAAAKKSAKFRLTAELACGFELVVVLRNGHLFLEAQEDLKNGIGPGGHPFTGYYFTHPGANPAGETQQPTEGVVSTISDDPPMLNWVFVDDLTGEVRHGTRTESIGHLVGPWGWTENEESLILDDDEGFVAVWCDGGWKLFFDIEGDGSGLPDGKIEEISLRRRLVCGVDSQYRRDSEKT